MLERLDLIFVCFQLGCESRSAGTENGIWPQTSSKNDQSLRTTTTGRNWQADKIL